MPKYFVRTLLFVFFCLVILPACQLRGAGLISAVKPTLPASVKVLPESEVQEIPLVGPAAEARAEISGMAWCGENLVLLPQYPDRFEEDGTANVFAIPQNILDDHFSGAFSGGITPTLVPFDTGGLERNLAGFEGFEAIVFNGSDFYVSVETCQRDGMMGYLVKGYVEPDCSRMVLDSDSVVSLQPQADIGNMSHETLVIYQDQLYAIYEANGLNVNPEPEAHVFDLSLESHTTVDLPNIEYRLTDATEPDSDGEFWAVNYFFPGDARKLEPAPDPTALAYGVGGSHQDQDTVERLIKFHIDEDSVRFVDRAPIYLELMEGDSRNWEGVVQYRDGFLLVTDRFPTTILAYVENSPNN